MLIEDAIAVAEELIEAGVLNEDEDRAIRRLIDAGLSCEDDFSDSDDGEEEN